MEQAKGEEEGPSAGSLQSSLDLLVVNVDLMKDDVKLIMDVLSKNVQELAEVKGELKRLKELAGVHPANRKQSPWG